MSFVGDMFSPAKGAGFQAQGAGLMDAVTQEQLSKAAGNVNSGLDQQMQFINALQAQNGIGNQSDVFKQQQALAGQLQQQANGQGPNPALQQLQNTTGQNVANQSAMMGSQRGASANPALLARLAAQQGASTQQQAAGQGAVLGAQQQIAAQQALQNQQNMMAGLATQQVGQQAGGISNYNQFAQGNQSALLNAANQRNAANVGMQQNINNAMGTIANTNAQGQWQTLGGAMSGLSSAGGMLGGGGGMAQGGMVQHYASGGLTPDSFAVSLPAPSNASADISGGGAPSVTNFDSGMTKAGQDVGKSLKKSPKGGPISDSYKMPEVGSQYEGKSPDLGISGVDPSHGSSPSLGANTTYSTPSFPAYDEGGDVEAQDQGRPEMPAPAAIQSSPLQVSQTPAQPNQPQSFVTQFMNESNASAPVSGGGAPSTSSFDSGMGKAFGGGKSGGGGGSSSMMSMLPMLAAAKDGGKVGGKANVPGNSLQNDRVPAMLSPGEIVLPRSVTKSSDPIGNASKFVAAVLAKESRKKSK